MKIWLPYVIAGSGADVYTRLLAQGLQSLDCEVIVTPVAHRWQYSPLYLRPLPAPLGTDLTLSSSWNGLALARKALAPGSAAEGTTAPPHTDGVRG